MGVRMLMNSIQARINFIWISTVFSGLLSLQGCSGEIQPESRIMNSNLHDTSSTSQTSSQQSNANPAFERPSNDLLNKSNVTSKFALPQGPQAAPRGANIFGFHSNPHVNIWDRNPSTGTIFGIAGTKASSESRIFIDPGFVRGQRYFEIYIVESNQATEAIFGVGGVGSSKSQIIGISSKKVTLQVGDVISFTLSENLKMELDVFRPSDSSFTFEAIIERLSDHSEPSFYLSQGWSIYGNFGQKSFFGSAPAGYDLGWYTLQNRTESFSGSYNHPCKTYRKAFFGEYIGTSQELYSEPAWAAISKLTIDKNEQIIIERDFYNTSSCASESWKYKTKCFGFISIDNQSPLRHFDVDIVSCELTPSPEFATKWNSLNHCRIKWSGNKSSTVSLDICFKDPSRPEYSWIPVTKYKPFDVSPNDGIIREWLPQFEYSKQN